MPRLSKPRLTDAESYALALAEADDATLTALTISLEDTFHYKQLVKPTLEGHERTKKLSFLELKWSLPARITKEFIRWLGVTLRGSLDRFVVKSTIEGYIFKFFALWRQYAFIPVPSEHRLHVMSYFYSKEFDDTSKLSTATRVKETANLVDVELLVKGVLEDKKYFRTNRARVDTIYSSLISALSSERPGAIVESTCYRNSNESLTYGNHDVWVIPNPDNPRRPFVCCIVRINLLKGHRDDDGFTKYFFLLAEPDSHRHVDALMYFMVNCFKDQVFEDVETPEEVFFPQHPCTRAHKLRIKKSALRLSVCRKEVYDGDKWVTSETLAMPYFMVANFLRKISLFLGFVVWITFYCFRRCSANNMNAALPEDERRRMMGQNPDSNQFFASTESYQSRLASIDLGAILAGRHEANEDNTNMMDQIRGMSKSRDANAPISLDVAELNELHADPELVEFRVKKVNLRAELKEEITKRLSIDKDDDVAMALQNAVINDLRTAIRTIDRKHTAIITRETYALVAAKRKAYFDEASYRVLNNIQPEQRIPLAAKSKNVPAAPPPSAAAARPGQENLAPGTAPPARRARVSLPAAPDPMAEALQVVYNFTPEDDGPTHFVASVNAFLGLPERAFKHGYPGESPTHDDKCPVCGADATPAKMNKSSRNVATHIHKCIMGKLKATSQQQIDSEYKPMSCLWTTCDDETEFATRAEFCEHVNCHLANLEFACQQGRPGAQCNWETDDQTCGERNCGDLETHFARVHGINVHEEIGVEYCPMFIDFDGDCGLWREHSLDHYSTLFSPFTTRVETPIDFSKHGVLFTAAVDHCIQFENGEGFGGERPEFHGHIDHQVPLAPIFCTNESFRLHLTGHYNEVVSNPGAQRECPVPSCGTHTFDALELLTHMVVFHRVPICGSDKHTNFRRLHLPNADDVQPVMDTEPVDLAHLNQQAPSESGPTPSGSTVPAPVVKKKRRYTQANPFQAVECLHKCEKHRAQFHDIREHIPAHCNETKFKIRDTTMKRGRFGPFYNFAEWSRTAPPFVPSGDAAENDDQDEEPETSEPGPSKKPRVEAEASLSLFRGISHS
ncbi:hypothetical protein C8R43DRAFT_1197899 [Mycena crocata]|nr:hypothetical protein C8R43DRAFT_1197899 [Mycena crocata]